ncbi:MAG: hypothetical protein EOM16_06230 [Bacteroidia bacterium]|nr:hypothetical protein [Bacteroidia bacterium]
MKINRSLYIIVLLLSCIMLFSCEKDKSGDIPDGRVVVLYMAANNNLASFAEYNLNSLKEGFIPGENSEDVLVIYQHLKGASPKITRLYKDSDNKIKEDVVAHYEDHNSAEGEVLKAVLNKVKMIFPAKEYGLILWSHATGWLPEGYYNSTKNATFFEDPYAGMVKSFGEDRGVEMELVDLNEALPYKFSFIIFDCCLMGGIETVYQLRTKTDYIVASPAEILANGFPYQSIMAPLFKREAELEKTCQLFYDYYSAQSGVNKSATIALYNTKEVESLAEITKDIYNNNREKIPALDLSGIQPYFRLNKSWFWDLGDFVGSISDPQERLMFESALDKVVVAKWSTPMFIDIPITSYSGISTYIPKPENLYLDNFYKTFDWNMDSRMIE